MKTKTTMMSVIMLGASLLLNSQLVNAQTWDLNGNTNATNNSILGASGAGINLRVFAGGSERMHINGTNGNIGIGTLAPTTKLHVVGTTRLQGATTVVGLTTTTTLKVTGGAPGVDKVLRSDAAGLASWVAAASVFNEVDPQVSSSVTGRLPRWNGTTLTDGSLFDNGTKVGIATTTPVVDLTIGSLNIFGLQKGSASPDAGFLRFGDNTGWKFHIGRMQEGSGAAINTTTTGVIMTVQDNGNVGIGVLSPTEQLQVSNNIESVNGDLYTSSGNGVINCGGGAQDPLVNIIGDDTTGFSTSGCNGDEDLYIDGDLAVMGVARKPGGGVWVTTSDARLKRDVKPYTDGLAKLLMVNPVNFKYLKELNYNDNDKEYTGIIAQDMQKIAPYMIEELAMGQKSHETENGKVVIDNPGKNYLTYDGTALTYMLVNAVKEQNQTIELLKAEIAELKSQNNSSDRTASSLGVYENVRLDQNIPNPFSEETTIHYYLPSNSTAVLKVMSLDGKEILSNSVTKTGNGEVRISGSTMAAGTYTYTLIVNGKAVESKIMVLTK